MGVELRDVPIVTDWKLQAPKDNEDEGMTAVRVSDERVASDQPRSRGANSDQASASKRTALPRASEYLWAGARVREWSQTSLGGDSPAVDGRTQLCELELVPRCEHPAVGESLQAERVACCKGLDNPERLARVVGA